MQFVAGSHRFRLDQPVTMGVLNITPDSFSDGGRFNSFDSAVVRAEEMLSQGAAIIDVGGESTRPGAAEVSEQQEIDRVIPVVEALNDKTGACISVDTSKAGVMRAAIAAGASLINDVFALQQSGTLEAVAGSDCGICLMHMQGKPDTMQDNPEYSDVTEEVTGFLEQRVALCRDAGIADNRVLIDPGFGFGKNERHNLLLLKNLGALTRIGIPVLVGLSRKRTLGAVTGRGLEQRLAAGLAAAVMAVERGAFVVRTHDVAETVDALKIVAAVSNAC